jgi:surface protein
MRGMFYNCQSLRSFNLDKFITSNNINEFVDLSYMFYNCKKLQTFLISNKFCVKDMNNMFYNCESLRSINMNYFYSVVDLHV